MTKILHYSDKGSDKFKDLYELCDIVVVTGDLTRLDFPENLSKKPAFGVYGNHDSGTYFEELGIINLHNNVIEFNGRKWGGFQGCLKYKESDLMYTEEEASLWAKNFPKVDILLLHAGPLGLLDDPSDQVHIGSPSVLSYVEKHKPEYIFVGHQYTDAFMEHGPTKLYRTYGARIIEIPL